MSRQNGFVTQVSKSYPVTVKFRSADDVEHQAKILNVCPIEVHDWIMCHGPKHGGVMQVTDYPQVVVTEQWTDMIDLISKYGYCSKSQAVSIANIIDQMTCKPGDGRALADWLDDHSYEYCDASAESRTLISDTIMGLPATCQQALMRKWYKERTMRQFRVLGLSENVIKAIKMKPSKLRKRLHENPFLILAIPLEICARLAEQYGLRVTEADRIEAEIARTMYRALEDGNHVCMTRKKILKQHPNLSQHQDGLEMNYRVTVIERGEPAEDLFYLDFPARVEETLVRRIQSMRQDAMIKPIAQPFSMDGQLVANPFDLSTQLFDDLMRDVHLDDFDQDRVEQARFLFENGVQDRNSLLCFIQSELSLSQMHAVHDLLTKGVACLTGGGGTGKCLVPGTLVRLADGRALAVEELTVGMELAHPVGRKATIKSLASGEAARYRVVTHEGLSGGVPHAEDRAEAHAGLSEGVPHEGLSEGVPHAEDRAEAHEGLSKGVPHAEVQSRSMGCNDEHILVYKLPASDTQPSGFRQESVKEFLLRPSAFRQACQLPVMEGDTMVFCPFVVEPLEYGPYCGFTLDGDGLFVLANGIVSHNTTCIRAMVDILDEREINYLLCAFTGKAVARIMEATGRGASTIHSLITALKYDSKLYSGSYYVIIDEAGMMNGVLLMQLLNALSGTKLLGLILVGDEKQLQPIGWSSPFLEILASNAVPVHHLTRIYRTMAIADGKPVSGKRLAITDGKPITGKQLSLAVKAPLEEGTVEANARRLALHDGSSTYKVLSDGSIEWVTKPFFFKESERFVLARGGIDKAHETYRMRLEEARRDYDASELPWPFLAKRAKADPDDPNFRNYYLLAPAIRRVAMLCPYNADVTSLNVLIQDLIYVLREECGRPPNSWDEPGHNSRRWFEHDRVMILKNKKGTVTVYNGDLGTIQSLPGQQEKYGLISLDRDGSVVRFAVDRGFRQPPDVIMLQDMDLGYAFTVDKSQGSEWDHVVYYVSRSLDCFTHLNRNYTAVTRAKKTCSIISGDVDRLQECTGRYAPWRSEGLAIRLREGMKPCLPVRNYMDKLYSGDSDEEIFIDDAPVDLEEDVGQAFCDTYDDYEYDGPCDFDYD